jgi:hypothetical protein
LVCPRRCAYLRSAPSYNLYLAGISPFECDLCRNRRSPFGV